MNIVFMIGISLVVFFLVFTDELHFAQKNTRIAFLEVEIQKIKTGNTRASSQEILNDMLSQYEKELAELKNSEQ